MKKYILIIISIIVLNGVSQAQDSGEIVSFTTNHAYIVSQEFKSLDKRAKWSILEFPQMHVRMEIDDEVRKFRIDEVKRIMKTSEESIIVITLKDVDQKFYLTQYFGGKGNFKMAIYSERFRQDDGTYTRVEFYTTYTVESITDLL